MSNQFPVDETRLNELKDSVVVLSGGANGIGRTTVLALDSAGAYTVFGDTDADAGADLIATHLSSRATFVRCDVTAYADVVALFKAARAAHGRVDHAVACAGVLERGRWFDAGLTLEDVESEESGAAVAVNLMGTAGFVRVALAYLRDGKETEAGEKGSVTLVSSAAGFRESPGLPMYQASKHGVQGLLRSLRKVIWPRDGIRINNVNPGPTDTAMTASIIEFMRKNNIPINTPEHIARVILAILVQKGLNGKGVYVEGGRPWEFEDGLQDTMELWLGEEPTARLKENVRLVAESGGSEWKIK